MSRAIFEPASGQRVPIQSWASTIHPETIRQLQHIAGKQFVVDRVAAMADAHVADGISVGTVFATEGILVPGAIGGDLGCGMLALRLESDAPLPDRQALELLLSGLERLVPAHNARTHGQASEAAELLLARPLSTSALNHTRNSVVPRHFATLGGGNHFLELDRDPEGGLWLLVHSGSRGMGGAIASHHVRAAGPPLGGLRADTEAGQAFLHDLAWAMDFARASRAEMADRARSELERIVGESILAGETIDVPHNFVCKEHWSGRDLLIHRKGAVAAPSGGLALVPGSMGTASYVVEGLGCELAFGSCSHGAGRVMTRGEARRRIDSRQLLHTLRHVVWPQHRSRDLVEEAPDVYRDIRQVLEDQRDLVTRKVRLEPLAVWKG
ncbi:MAG: RtcB family protein [Deltaproteobacteria bacterium]|nr:RtcB family protein [Deltaproteobacteria bacterium]